MRSGHTTATPRRKLRPSCCHRYPPRSKGRGECRVPAAPVASRGKNKNHTSVVTTGKAGITRHSRTRMVLTVSFVLPGDRAFLPPSHADCSAHLTPASGRQDHTTSLSAGWRVRQRAAASTASLPYVRDDRETPLCVGRDGASYGFDLGDREGKYFSEKDWTGSISLIWFEKFAVRRRDEKRATSPNRRCEPTGRANARPMTGSAKQSISPQQRKNGLLRRFAPRNDGGDQDTAIFCARSFAVIANPSYPLAATSSQMRR